MGTRLRQYPKRVAEPLPQNGYWFITRSAEFNAEWHADVVLRWDHVQEARYKSSGDFDIVDEERVVPLSVPALVTESKITKGTWMVHDRLTPLLTRKEGHSTVHNVPMDFYIDADSPSRLIFNVYYSSTGHQDQEPLRNKKSLIHPEFTTIQMTFADIPSLEDAGFKEEQHGQTHFYHLCGLTRMQCGEDHLQLELNLFAPGMEPHYIEGESEYRIHRFRQHILTDATVDMRRLPPIIHSDMKEIWYVRAILIICVNFADPCRIYQAFTTVSSYPR